MDLKILASLVGSAATALASLATIVVAAQKFLAELSKSEEGHSKVGRLSRYAAIALFALLIGGTAGAYLVYKQPQATGGSSPTVVPTTQAPATPAQASPPKPQSSIVQQKGRMVAQSPSQGGVQKRNNNQQVIVGGSITQGGDGDCQQNILEGNNNTLNCAPRPIRVSDAQVEIIIRELKQSGVKGSVNFAYEYSAEYAPELMRQLERAFGAVGIEWKDMGGTTILGDRHPYPGISFGPLDRTAQPLAEALSHALLQAKVIHEPLKPPPGQRWVVDDGIQAIVLEFRKQ
jgi:hypothetical protein